MMMHTVAVILLVVAAAGSVQSSRTFPYDSCSSNQTVIQYVGAADTNAAGCIWAGQDINSAWFGSCVQQWQVDVNQCNITMTPTVNTTDEGCPCWWFGLKFVGSVSEATAGNLTQVAPLADINASIKRIKWAADNTDAYQKCFLDSTFLSDQQSDIVKSDRASTLLNVLGEQMQNIGLLPYAHPLTADNSTNSAASNAAMMVTSSDQVFKLSRKDKSIYFGDSQCSFKFQIKDNDRLLAA